MGITNNCVKFLSYSHRMDVSFKDTLMLGRQQLYANRGVVRRLLKAINPDANFAYDNSNIYSEPLFKALGAQKVDSIDFSDYENATFVHDLNSPIPDELKNQYTLVFDGGTLEHVFNFPIAIANCMSLLKVGGDFISITPTNNQCGHGFYQFSPELYFSVFNESRGFRVKSVFIAIDVQGEGIKEWYKVKEPSEVKTRVTISNCDPTYLLVLAEKIKDTPNFLEFPYQSDYINAWKSFDSFNNESLSPLKRAYRKLLPEFIRDKINKLRAKKSKKQNVSGLGDVNPEYFEKVDLK